MFQEITEVLARPKFAKLIAPEQRCEVSDLLVSAAVWAEWRGPRIEDCRDRKDNIYLELALAADAFAVISGDDDLLVLDPWRNIRILSPAASLQWETGAKHGTEPS